MVIDSQAIKHLQILDVEGLTKSTYEGSLLHYLDNTKTPFGKRLLKKWTCTPLTNIDKINKRLDSIEDLMKHPDAIVEF
jgi:DNA mismatch repair protein MSH6